jgi:hypothetical protein
MSTTWSSNLSPELVEYLRIRVSHKVRLEAALPIVHRDRVVWFEDVHLEFDQEILFPVYVGDIRIIRRFRCVKDPTHSRDVVQPIDGYTDSTLRSRYLGILGVHSDGMPGPTLQGFAGALVLRPVGTLTFCRYNEMRIFNNIM